MRSIITAAVLGFCVLAGAQAAERNGPKVSTIKVVLTPAQLARVSVIQTEYRSKRAELTEAGRKLKREEAAAIAAVMSEKPETK